ncbi:MAG: cytidine deaminase [Verrucomicrobiae bacterium]|nr:cytidine deaminase [Verrucomicrobiae bacterium]NNJ41876.1 cytidine deaminase [Akkermansiaceae bacterium]
MEPSQLTQIAADARDAAYAPYSKFKVGAALLTDNGEVFTGCNIENASFGLTICAERTALFAAVAAGVRTFSGIAVSSSHAVCPCGACRQVLNEFNPTLDVYLGDETGQMVTKTSLDRLLPEAFGPDNLR